MRRPVGSLPAALLLVLGATACVRQAPLLTPVEPAGPGVAEATAPLPLTNTLRWTTASELHNFAFDVYRADTPEGPFARMTAKPIPGAGTSDTPTDYVWVDRSIEAGQDYYYYVESISLSGRRERFTPVIHAPAKQRPPG